MRPRSKILLLMLAEAAIFIAIIIGTVLFYRNAPDLMVGAIRLRSPGALRLLLALGANPNSLDQYGERVADNACWYYSPECLAIMLEAGAKLSEHGAFHAVDHLTMSGDVNMARRLIKAGFTGSPYFSYLMIYSGVGDTANVDEILDSGQHPDEPGVACRETPLSIAALCGRDRVIEILLKAGADPNLTKGFFSPLSNAAQNANEQSIKLLLEAGADPNLRPKNGNPPLLTAVAYRHWDNAIMLLEAGADVRLPGRENSTCLHKAVSPDLIGTDSEFHELDGIHAPSSNNRAEWITLLLTAGADIDAQDSSGRTPLMLAAADNRPDAVILLLAAGADPFLTDAKGENVYDQHYLYNESGIVLSADLLMRHLAYAMSQLIIPGTASLAAPSM